MPRIQDADHLRQRFVSLTRRGISEHPRWTGWTGRGSTALVGRARRSRRTDSERTQGRLKAPKTWSTPGVTGLANALPNDVETLKAMLLAERARADRLAQIIKELQRHRFGRRAETLPLDQLELGLEDVQQVEAAAAAETEKTDPAARSQKAKQRRANRGSLPAHLPRVEVVVDVESKACPCCSGELHRIGEDVAERLDIIPAQLRVLVTRRPKYACRACEEGVVQAPAPARLIEGGLPTEATVAHVVVAKYADHLPLYRQAQIYARQGVQLDRSTLADWVGRAAWLLGPVHARLLERLKASQKLFADETTAPVLDPGRGRTKTGQLWAYARDDRAWCGPDPPGVAYVYAPDRKAERPISPPQRLPRRAAGRWLRRLPHPGGEGRRAPGLLLGPRPPSLLRARRCRPGAHRLRSPPAHRRTLRR